MEEDDIFELLVPTTMRRTLVTKNNGVIKKPCLYSLTKTVGNIYVVQIFRSRINSLGQTALTSNISCNET